MSYDLPVDNTDASKDLGKVEAKVPPYVAYAQVGGTHGASFCSVCTIN